VHVQPLPHGFINTALHERPPVTDAIKQGADTHNPVIQQHFKALIQRGKPYKVALVAIMRKMIVILNAILKTGQPWRGANTA